jgi:quinolinate synthase
MNTIEKIIKIKNELGKKLIILTHHYQRKEIVELGDYKGDSFDLSQKAAANKDAEYIVFCGVHFMAESAAILAEKDKTIQIPDIKAGCSMADMITFITVQKSWNELIEITGKNSITPIVYMNSAADIKDFCGRNEGIVCTSSNADKAVKWALNRREKVFFLPDEHLGRNTAKKFNIPKDEVIVWEREKPFGGNTPDKIKKARLILWNGFCSIHTHFTTEHIEKKRKSFPDAKIIVHPECPQEVVNSADGTGSTTFIVNYVKDAPKNSTIIIGTEINLITRLADEYPDKKIMTLDDSLCTEMYKITPEKLLSTLENIGTQNVVTVEESIKKGAKLALNRMLKL